MKDEELAEKEYENLSQKKIEQIGHYCDKAIYVTGFLAGLKAGRPQWHKVADGDLPTTVGRRFLVSNRYCSMIGYWNGKTFVSADEDVTEIASPIAWCEIPTFDKE